MKPSALLAAALALAGALGAAAPGGEPLAAGIKVTTDRWPDTSSLEAFGRDAVRLEGAKTDEGKALAVYRWTRRLIYRGYPGNEPPAKPGGRPAFVGDPLRLLNVYGVGYCSHQTRVMEATWRALGYRALKCYKSGHTMVQLRYRDGDGDERWHHFDPMRSCFAFTRDGSRLVGADDICRDPSVLVRPSKTTLCTRPPARLFGWVHTRPLAMPPAHDTSLSLSPGERLTLRWEGNGHPWYFQPWGDDTLKAGLREYGPYGKPAPARGELLCEPLVADGKRPGLVAGTARGLAVVGGEMRPAGREEGVWLYEVRLPYIVGRLEVSGKFRRGTEKDFLVLECSVDGGKSWRELGEPEVGEKLRSFAVDAKSGQVKGRGKKKYEVPAPPRGSYAYWLRLRMRPEDDPAQVGARDLRVLTTVQAGRLALPRLLPGENMVRVAAGKLSAGTALSVEYVWDDQAGKGRRSRAVIEKPPFEYEILAAAGAESKVVTRRIEIVPVPADGRGNRVELREKQVRVAITEKPRDLRQLVGPGKAPPLRSRAEYEKLLETKGESKAARNVGRDAAAGLGELADPASLPALLKCLRESENYRAVIFAGAALASMKKHWASNGAKVDAAQLEAIVPAVMEADKRFPGSAALPWALGELGDPRAIPHLDEQLAKVRKMKGRAAQSAWAIAEALGKVGDGRSVAPLMEELRGNSDGASSAAKGFISLAGRHRKACRAAVPLLSKKLLACQYSTVRIHAAEALGAIGDRGAVPALTRALADEQEEVWGRAAEALGRIGHPDPAAIAALEARVAKKPRPWEVWAAGAAREALKRLGK